MRNRGVTSRSFINRLPGFRHRRRSGQAVFEFMLILPFFMIFILLTVDLGILMYEYVSVANAAREGARYGSVKCANTCTPALIQQRVLARSGGIVSNTGEVSVSWCERETPTEIWPTRGDSVVVRVDHTYNFLFIQGASIQVQSSVDMRLESTDSTSTLAAGASC